MSSAPKDSVAASADPTLGRDIAIPLPEFDGLLHNMSAPPKSVVRFEGLGGLARKGSPRSTGIASLGYEGEQLFGAPVRFSLPDAWRGLALRDLVRAIDPACRSRTRQQLETRLLRWIDERTAALPLPDGCLVVPAEDGHPAPWADGLAALAVLSRCADTVWLRDKEPSWTAGIARAAVSLLVPPAFVSCLSTEPETTLRVKESPAGRSRR